MLDSLWNQFLLSLVETKNKNPVMYSILNQLKPVELHDKKIILSCTNQAFALFLQRKIPEIEELVSAHLKKVMSVEVIVVTAVKKQQKEEPLLTFQPSKEDLFRRSGLNGKYTFENFAVSGSNQVAYAAAQAVADNPAKAYNPLLFYGGVGVGKTHLAQAVAHKILEDNEEKKVFFSPGDQFTNELIESIREKNTGKFRRKYRSLDMLIVDDVQFIAGKNTIQEEFFHTFNSIVSSGGQIILTSDKPPHEIKNLEDRLRSRFSGGLIVDVQAPDFELRTAILLIKAKEKNIDIDIELAKIIAEQVEDSRALEGALLSIYARTIGTGEKITLDTVEEYFNKQNKVEKVKQMNPADIIKTVCSYYNVKQSHLKSSVRSDRIALPRQVAMFLLRQQLGMTHQEIAFLLRRKDHTTIMHGVEKISRLLVKNVDFKQEVDRIIQSLRLST